MSGCSRLWGEDHAADGGVCEGLELAASGTYYLDCKTGQASSSVIGLNIAKPAFSGPVIF